MKVVTFKAEEYLIELLDRYAIKYGLNRSEAMINLHFLASSSKNLTRAIRITSLL